MRMSIVFEWWKNGKDEIPENHKTDLIEHALERIIQTKDGFVWGELHYIIENIRYDGFWEIKEVI